MNKITIIGNLGKAPEMRYTPSGQAVTSFPVASNSQYKTQSGEVVKETTWFRVSAWGKQAEICNEYLKKGAKVYLEGVMSADKSTGAPRIWTDKDGSAHTGFEVRLNHVEFLSPRVESGTGEAQESPVNQEDGVPF